ncbi:MAG: ATP-dependent ligase [Hyphomicrobiales bacterium]|nr:ATP-dependent ligase [Hyphomicrobiales bacterium]
MKRRAYTTVAFALMSALLAGVPASAHFQEILPSADVLPDGGKVTIDLVFTHPMEGGPVMEMKRPKRVGALVNGKTLDLSAGLKASKKQGAASWTLTHELKEPGAAIFFVEPEAYWEPGEGKYIIHYAKVVVDGFASGKGWDEKLGLPVEIEPLARPSGLWTGNLFRGIVRRNGAPVPFAEVEVEYVNEGGAVKAPNDAFVTQVIKADAQGVFAYAMPRAGWWGFAALIEGDEKMKSPDGKDAPVELGGLIWVKATDMTTARPAGKR